MTTLDRPKLLNAIVLAELIAAITSGRIRFGELLSEKTVAASFGTSKTPVREAFFQLQSLGLVEILPQRGCLVFQPTVKAVDDLCEFRIVLETTAIACAMAASREGLLSGLRAAHAVVESRYRTCSRADFNVIDDAFHSVLLDQADNGSLLDAYNVIRPRISTLRVNLQLLDGYLIEISVGDHRDVLVALERDDLATANRRLAEHVRRISAFYRDRWDELVGSRSAADLSG